MSPKVCWLPILIGFACRPVTPSVSEPQPRGPSACLSASTPPDVARALATELLARKREVPAFAQLTGADLKDDRIWWVTHGEVDVPNPAYERELSDYREAMAQRRREEARGVKLKRAKLDPPSPTRKALGPRGLDLRVEFHAADPRIDWARSQAATLVEPVDGGETIALAQYVRGRTQGFVAHVGDTWVTYTAFGDGAATHIEGALRALASRIDACR